MGHEFDFESFKASALEQMRAGKPLTGRDGVLAPLLENLLNAAFEGEMDAHLDDDERIFGNRRNGHTGKHIQSSLGELNIATPRDRDATFDPVMVKKRERILADSLADRIIGLYAVGTSTRGISRLMEEQFGNRISPETNHLVDYGQGAARTPVYIIDTTRDNIIPSLVCLNLIDV